MRFALLLTLIASPAIAGGPVFESRSEFLPVPHIYSGGWEHFVGGGVAVFDCNSDGLPEIFAAGGEEPSRLFINTTGSSGADISYDLGNISNLPTGITGAYPLDIDSNGHLDLFVLRVGRNLVLRGNGGCRFEDATEEFGLEMRDAWSTSFTATWEPGNAFPTLAVGNYVDRTDPEGPFEACDSNDLYRSAHSGYGPPSALEPGYCALSMLFSDWQRRGRADLRISNDRHYYVRDGYEQMWRLDDLRSLDDRDGWERLSIWGMGIASRDLGGDGRPDVFLTSMGDQILQISKGKTSFEAAPFGMGTYAQRPHVGDDGRPSTGWHAEFGDVNNDGLADLFVAKGNVDQMPGSAMEDPNNLLLQQPDGSFVERSVTAGVATLERSRGAALADLNGDGRLDLVVVNRRAPMEVWQNMTPDAGNWIGVDLRQSGSNTRGVGSWVEVLSDGKIQTQELTVGGGHAGGQSMPLHFGLDQATNARVRVTWPNGFVGAWRDVKAGEVALIERR